MKYKLLFLLLITSFCHADVTSFPEPKGYVTDSAGILSFQDVSAITGIAEELERKTTAQLAVVTVKTTQPETIEDFSVKLFEKWKIGQKGKDNGILLLIASSDRKVRIETGYGIEGILPDATCKMIIENEMLPYFKRGEYSQGILSGASAIIAIVSEDYGTKVEGSSMGRHRKDKPSPIFWILTLLFAIPLIIAPMLGVSGRRRRCSRHSFWGLGSGGFSGGFSSFGGSGGFSGGFGGFGGGSSGGGGASGSW
ncbi:TPM domain-containing protein [bacterium]|nr:TPM domain-containing protein [bacterium]MBU2461455.1 TPM domain-containing protein [bacterium]